MSQSKRHSALETATNTAVGFVGSYALTILCMQHVHLNAAQQSLLIVVLCTVWSLLRGYYLRRLFNYLHTKSVQEFDPGPAGSATKRPTTLCRCNQGRLGCTCKMWPEQ